MLISSSNNKALVVISVFSMALMSGCQVVSLKKQAINTTIANERNSILTQSKLSEASLNVLSISGKVAKVCNQSPEDCVADLHKLPQILDEQLYSTASELYLAKSMALASSSNCKVSLLTKHRAEEEQQAVQKNYEQCLDKQLETLDNRQVQIRDFYNRALTELVNVHRLRNPSNNITPTINIGKSTYTIDIQSYQRLQNIQLEKFISSYNMNFSGLRAINRRDGFGSDFVAVFPTVKSESQAHKYILNPLANQYSKEGNPNIHKARYLAATIIAQPTKSNASVDDVLNNPNFEIKVYDPYRIDKVNISGQPYSLAANFSAPYGLWLA